MARPITAKTKFKRSPKRNRIKSATKRLRQKNLYRKSIQKSVRNQNQNANHSFLHKGTNISVSSKQLSRGGQSNMPTHYMTMTNNFMSTTDEEKRKRIYSAKPAVAGSRKFMPPSYNMNDPYIVNLSPSHKIPETSYIRFSTQTAPSTVLHTKPTHMSLTATNNWRNDAWLSSYKQNSRSTETSLSNLTHVQNNHALNQLEMLEKIREKESETKELTSLKHVDCK